jgi:crossover junction endodeoxyribonuclease RuvC
MLTIGLDLSLTGSGICRGGETIVLKDGGLRGVHRLDYLEARIMGLCAGADAVAIEGYSYGSSNKAHQIGELGGVVRLGLRRAGVPFVEIPPTCRMKYATGKGQADKDKVLSQAVLRSGRAMSNDEADAWWLWQMLLAHYWPEDPALVIVPKIHRDALAGVEWVNLKGGPCSA